MGEQASPFKSMILTSVEAWSSKMTDCFVWTTMSAGDDSKSAIDLVDKLNGCVIGCIVADAAAQPCHWVYDQQKLQDLATPEPEFLEPPLNPFYHIPNGSNSCYGDQAFVTLRSIATHSGIALEEYAQEFAEFFGNEGEGNYGKFPFENVPRDQLPIKHGWRVTSIKLFLNNVISKEGTSKWTWSGSMDDQADCVAKIAPIVALYARKSDSEMFAAVESAVRITQVAVRAVMGGLSFAKFLKSLIHGNSAVEAFEDCKQFLKEKMADESRPDLVEESQVFLCKLEEIDVAQEHSVFVKSLGLGCGMPFCMQNALHAVLKFDPSHDTFETGVRRTILAGGDSAARSCMVGACLGAILGHAAIPECWINRTLKSKKAAEFTSEITKLA
jgi:ADP-ribosylglycohydrolase